MQITIVEKININSSCIADNCIQTGDYSEIADLLSEINGLAHAMEESSNSQDEISHYFKIVEKIITLHNLISNEGLKFSDSMIFKIVFETNNIIKCCDKYPIVVNSAFCLLVHISYSCNISNEDIINEMMRNLNFSFDYLVKIVNNICCAGYEQTLCIFDWVYEIIVFTIEDKFEHKKLNSEKYK